MFEYDERMDQLLIKNGFPMHIYDKLGIFKTKDFTEFSEKNLLSLGLKPTEFEKLWSLHKFIILYTTEWSWREAYKLMFDNGLLEDKGLYEKLFPKIKDIKVRRTRNSHGKLQITNLTDREMVMKILRFLIRMIQKRKEHSSPDSLHDLLSKLKTIP
jgi:hypothetical protein